MSDPYDFEIALPAAPSNASRSTKKHRSTCGSDEDASDFSGSLSNMSGISSDNDSEGGSGHEWQHQAESNFKRPTKSANESRTAAPSSGSALDRAKNFLSKYSSGATGDPNGAKAPTSSRSRCIDLDDDDDEAFSMESSSDAKEYIRKKQAATTTSSSVVTAHKRENDPLKSSEDYGFVTKDDEAQFNRVEALRSEDEEGSGQSSDHAPPYNTAHRVIASHAELVTRHDESNSDRSHAGDSIESFHSGPSEERSENLTVEEALLATQPKTTYQDHHEESADNYNESFQEESLSQSYVVDNRQQIIRPSQATPAFTSVKPHQSIASESGVYEEEAFEDEDSAVTTPAQATSSSAVVSQPILSTEKNFDYSMNFSDDEVEGQVQLQLHASQTAHNDSDPMPGSSESRSISCEGNSDKESGEQSAFLASDSFHEVRGEVTISVVGPTTMEQLTGVSSEVPVAHPAPIPELGLEPKQKHTSSTQDGPSRILGNTCGARIPLNKLIDTHPVTAARISPREAECAGEDMAASRQPHVSILRAFEPNKQARVEMKDASTQFTGNHAAIQTDLIPDGMHNLLVPAPSVPTATASRSFSRESEVSPCDAKPFPYQSDQQPPPPISPLLGSSMYSLDTLKLQRTPSTSIYKQQLLALQEQILQKKRETERIVRDRMTFQYSSLRGTERFMAARRAQKLELWEALMRVDPTLDERKAREVARLAQAASTRS